MVLKPEPVFACVEALQSGTPVRRGHLPDTPTASALRRPLANELSLRSAVILLCGHYKGIDERIREGLVTREMSIGDYVLTGGELPAMVVIDTVVRLLPGVLHDGESLLTDSFQDNLLGAPCYTRPAEFRGMARAGCAALR